MDDEELVETDVPTVGERLRAAREEKGLSLEDIAAQTRIPQRHLESIEKAEWDKLPAPTYTTGFAKSYASAVGLDRAEIGDQLRSEMGGQSSLMPMAEVFEPADPARTMPKSLVFGAIAVVLVLVLVMSWLNRRSLEPDENVSAPVAEAPAAAPAPVPAQAQARPAPQQPVVITATDLVWMQVYEKSGATLFSGMLQPGQSFPVPPNSTAPLLKTGKPEALRITVGSQVAPPVGPPAKKVSDVSLLAANLLNPGAAQPQPAPLPAQSAPPRQRTSSSTAAPPPPADTTPANTAAPTTNAGE